MLIATILIFNVKLLTNGISTLLWRRACFWYCLVYTGSFLRLDSLLVVWCVTICCRLRPNPTGVATDWTCWSVWMCYLSMKTFFTIWNNKCENADDCSAKSSIQRNHDHQLCLPQAGFVKFTELCAPVSDESSIQVTEFCPGQGRVAT